MSFTSLNFLLFVVAVALLYNASRSMLYRRWVLLAANLLFIGSFVTRPLQLLPLLAFLAFGYAIAVALLRQPSRFAFGVAIGALIAAFIFLKRYSFLGGNLSLPFPYLEVGLSYILFRLLQMAIDGYSGEIRRSDSPLRSPLSFLNYTCNFLCFVSGPIQRSQNFTEEESRQSQVLDADRAFAAFARIIKGYIKVAVISAIAFYLFTNLSETVLSNKPVVSTFRFTLMYAVAAVAYTAYLYYNFSGYMDIVIGIGWLLGQELPENFDKPFSARGLLEFWTRWHMTLSEWFKTYLFNPLMMALGGRITNPSAMPYLGVLTFFITFFVMGVWHGSTAVFVIYGLLMGAGVSINKLWQIYMTKRLGKKGYKAFGERKLYQYACRGVTFAYFSIAVTGLWVDMPQLATLGGHLGPGGLVITFAAIAFGFAFMAFIWDAVLAVLNGGNAVARLVAAPALRQFTLAGQVLMILAITSFFHKAPEFVYKAF